MNRSLLAHSLYRGADSDGGAADLQTDVMRFMAILSLCLVAIFALVQSIPYAPASRPEPAEVQATPEPVPAPEPDSETAAEPEPAKPATTSQAAPAVVEPFAEPLPPPLDSSPRESALAPAREAAAAAPRSPLAETPAEQGFTLRFESDRVLTRLVAERTVGLYAITDGAAQRLDARGGRLSFWAASTPSSFHEMDPATVPADVRAALVRSTGEAAARWAVTLPAAMSRALDGYLARHSGGDLVIGADGALRLEP